jgi:protein TonB
VSTASSQGQSPTAPLWIPGSLHQPIPESSNVNPLSSVIGPQPLNLPESVAAALVIEKVLPKYPEQAIRAGLQGPVVLQALIGADGAVRGLKLVTGYLILGRAAYDAVRQWRYKPYMVNGRAVETRTYVTFHFHLPGEAPVMGKTAAPSMSTQVRLSR